MSGIVLFLRTRGAFGVLLGLVVVAAAQRAAGQAGFLISGGYDVNVPWSIVLPAATGAVAGTCTHAPLAVLERGGARSLPLLRGAHVGLILGVAVVLTIWATASVEGAYSTPAAIRNLLGFAGIALITAAVVGAALAWLPTVGFAIVAVVAGAEAGVAHVWAWPIHANDDVVSWVTAAALFLVGAAAVLARGPRRAIGT